MSGKLYVGATPIGHLGDATHRLLQVARSVAFILCEHPEHSARWLNHYGIKARLVHYHAHNEVHRTVGIIKQLQEGADVLLVSDAGTPTIQDPGFALVLAARAANIACIPLPGANAAVSALSVSGLPAQPFLFVGFAPQKSISAFFEAYATLPYTLIFYVAAKRVVKTVDAAICAFGHARRAILAKEISKVHERVVGDTLADIQAFLTEDAAHAKGEFVLLVAGAQDASSQTAEISPLAVKVLSELYPRLSMAESAAMAARITGERKSALRAYLVRKVRAG